MKPSPATPPLRSLGAALVILSWLLLFMPLSSGCKSAKTTGAILRHQERNYPLAIQLARQAIADDPGDADAYYQLGLSYSMLDSVSLAYASFVTFIKLTPDNAKRKEWAENNIRANFVTHYNRGQIANQHEDYETAAREFQIATEADPRDVAGFYELGVSYWNLAGEDPLYLDLALDVLGRVLTMASSPNKYYLGALEVAGKCLVAANRENEAAERFRRLVDASPASYAVVEQTGNDLLKREEWESATVFLGIALDALARIGADDFVLRYNLGTAWYNMRRDGPHAARNALEHYKKAHELKPDDSQTIFNIMAAHMSLGSWQQAIHWGESYVQANPEDSRGWRLLARGYTEVGDKQKARECLARSKRVNPPREKY